MKAFISFYFKLYTFLCFKYLDATATSNHINPTIACSGYNIPVIVIVYGSWHRNQLNPCNKGQILLFLKIQLQLTTVFLIVISWLYLILFDHSESLISYYDYIIPKGWRIYQHVPKYATILHLFVPKSNYNIGLMIYVITHKLSINNLLSWLISCSLCLLLVQLLGYLLLC